MPQDKSTSAVAKGLKMTKFGSNSSASVVQASNNTNTTGSGGDRTGNQSIATSNTSGNSSCHHHYHHHYPPKHRRTASGQSNTGCIDMKTHILTLCERKNLLGKSVLNIVLKS